MLHDYCIYWIRDSNHTDLYKQGYIGITNDYNRRIKQHARNDNFGQNTHGWDNLVKEKVVDGLSMQEAFVIEHHYRPEPHIGWNVAKGGGHGGPLSDETKKKMSHAHKGMKHTAETKKKISIANTGHVVTKETRDKISKANKGHIVTEATRAIISKTHKGKVVSAETRRKLSKNNIGRKYDDPDYLAKRRTPTSRKGKAIRKALLEDIFNEIEQDNGFLSI